MPRHTLTRIMGAGLVCLATSVTASSAASFEGVGRSVAGDIATYSRVEFDRDSLFIDDGACEERGWIEVVGGNTIRSPDAPGTSIPPSILWSRISGGTPFYVVFPNCGQAELTCQAHTAALLICTGQFWSREPGREAVVEYWLADQAAD